MRKLDLTPEEVEERKEIARVRSRKWHADNRERANERSRQYREDNLERLREYDRERDKLRREDPEYVEAKKRSTSEWKERNRDKVLAARRRYQSARRARLRGAFVEAVDPETCYRMHGGRCGICGEFIDGAFHVDHIRPLSKGGKHSYINCQPAHPSCNQRKSAKWPAQT